MTLIALVPPIYINVMQYGPSNMNNGVVDATPYIAAACADAQAAGGGTVFLPAGVFATTGVVLSGLTNVVIKGSGSGTILASSSGATGIAITGSARCGIEDLEIDGSLHGGAIGISVSGNMDGHYENLMVKGNSGDGIFVQGDSASFNEHFWVSITCRANGGYGYHYQRTTTTDRGSSHFTQLKILYDGTGTGGIFLESTTGVSTIADHWFIDTIVDSYVSTYGVRIKDFVHVTFVGLWTGGTYSASSAILLEGACYGIVFNGLYVINIGTGAGTYGMSFNGTTHDCLIDNAILDATATTTAAIHVGSTGANITLGGYVLPLSTVPLSDTLSAFFNRSYSMLEIPKLFITNQSTTFGCIGIDDAGNPGHQKWIRNNGGSFQIVNTAYNTTLFRVDDGGYTVVGSTLNLNGFSSLLSGTGAPATGLGAVGDYYFRQDTPGTYTQRLYVKTASAVWTELQAPVQSATAVAIAANGAIATAGLDASRLAPTAARTAITMQAGTYAAQQCFVINESAFVLTYNATPATSLIANSAAVTTLPATSGRLFVWDSATSLWY